MPKLLEESGFAIHLRTRDHPPPHVHVFKGGHQAKIGLSGAEAMPFVMRVWGMSDRDLVRAMNLMLEHQDRLLDEWRKFYGA